MIEALKPTAGTLFGQPVHFDIPPYQRNYVWTRDAHWEPLWQDISKIAHIVRDAVKQGLIDPRKVQENDIDAHFFGSLITKFKGQSGHISQYTVIDGQQRITTLQLLMAAAIDVFEEHGAGEFSVELHNYAFNVSHSQISSSHELKLDPKVGDYTDFAHIMETTKNGGSKPQSRTSLTGCYWFYHKRVTDFIAANKGLEKEYAQALYLTLGRGIKFVEIQLLGNENEHTIFETLNARGKPLSEFEKSKNYMLAVATDLGDDNYGTYQDYLERFDAERFWLEPANQPRFEGSRVGLFFQHWVHIEIGTRPSNDDVYRSFRRHVETSIKRDPMKFDQMLHRMVEFADAFEQILLIQRDGSSAGVFEYRRNVLNIGVIMPLMMVLKRTFGTLPDFERGLEILESYLMRRFVVNASNRGLDDVVARILSEAGKDKRVDFLRILKRGLARPTGGARWPDDDEVYWQVADRDMYSTSASLAPRIRLVLEGIAQRLHVAEASLPFDQYGKLTIEHVVPKSWDKHWNAVGEDTDLPNWDLELGRLGNLTLVSGPMNSKLSNKSWDEKRPILERDNLYLNRDIVENIEVDRQWDIEAIRERGRRMAALICEIWPKSVD